MRCLLLLLVWLLPSMLEAASPRFAPSTSGPWFSIEIVDIQVFSPAGSPVAYLDPLDNLLPFFPDS